eukprot:1194426-Prorocentrum_minimum.AAC.4
MAPSVPSGEAVLSAVRSQAKWARASDKGKRKECRMSSPTGFTCYLHYTQTPPAPYPNATCTIPKRHLHHTQTPPAPYPNAPRSSRAGQARGLRRSQECGGHHATNPFWCKGEAGVVGALSAELDEAEERYADPRTPTRAAANRVDIRGWSRVETAQTASNIKSQSTVNSQQSTVNSREYTSVLVAGGGGGAPGGEAPSAQQGAR